MEKKEYKLTLSVEKEIVEKAKVYASEEHNSISSLVTDFLETYIAMKSSENNPSKGDNSHASKFAGIISLNQNKSNQTDIASAILDKHKKRFK
ncbi:MAG: DUF6364 family protein [bacterium]|nr:DUF6364 family protein [bacterium]